jgi:hypothetical protein
LKEEQMIVNLLRAGVYNFIAMNGTKMPNAIRELGKRERNNSFF